MTLRGIAVPSRRRRARPRRGRRPPRRGAAARPVALVAGRRLGRAGSTVGVAVHSQVLPIMSTQPVAVRRVRADRRGVRVAGERGSLRVGNSPSQVLAMRRPRARAPRPRRRWRRRARPGRRTPTPPRSAGPCRPRRRTPWRRPRRRGPPGGRRGPSSELCGPAGGARSAPGTPPTTTSGRPGDRGPGRLEHGGGGDEQPGVGAGVVGRVGRRLGQRDVAGGGDEPAELGVGDRRAFDPEPGDGGVVGRRLLRIVAVGPHAERGPRHPHHVAGPGGRLRRRPARSVSCTGPGSPARGRSSSPGVGDVTASRNYLTTVRGWRWRPARRPTRRPTRQATPRRSPRCAGSTAG